MNCTDTWDLLAETNTSVATISIINPHLSRYFFTVSFKRKIILINTIYIQWHHSDRISVAHPDLPDVETIVLENGMESVLEWSQLPGNATVYTVDMIPQPNNAAFVHLQLSYSTRYDMNITATTLWIQKFYCNGYLIFW